jgi:hypothetical protein
MAEQKKAETRVLLHTCLRLECVYDGVEMLGMQQLQLS